MKATALLFSVLALLIGLGPSLGCPPARAEDSSPALIIRGARLLEGERSAPVDNAVVVVRGGLIAKVFIDGESSIPRGRVIDAHGGTVLPGLIDSHVHLAGTSGARISAEEFAGGRIEHNLAAYLFFGVTTIRSLGDAPRMVFGLKGLDLAAEARAPRILAAGPVLTAQGAAALAIGTNPGISGSPVAAALGSESEARSKVRELIAAGANAIKVIYEEGPPARRVPLISESIFRAIVAEAHLADVPVCVHTATCREVQAAARAGADSVEHGVVREPIDDETIRVLLEHKMFYCPTLGVIEAPIRIAEGFGADCDSLLSQSVLPAVWASISNPASMSSRVRANPKLMEARKRTLRQAVENLSRVYRAGIQVTAGTDSGNEGAFPGASLHREVELLVDAGVSPMDAIKAATSTAARSCRIEAYAGSIRVGRRADLLVVEGNPLESISALRHIKLVVIGGKIVDRQRLFEAEH